MGDPAEEMTAYELGFWEGMKPQRLISVSEWADEYRYLSGKGSAEPGRYKTSRTPYVREILDCLSPSSPIQEVVWMSSSQVGKSEALNSWIGHSIDTDPGPIMMVQPTVDLAKKYSKQRIDPMIEATPRLKDKVSEAKERDTKNNMLWKEFPGGVLILTGANSAVGLRSTPVKKLGCDEVDGYPGDVEGEGDPVDLAKARTRTYARKKIFLTSTPTFEGRSRIQIAFLSGDQRYYHLPCPHCGEFQILKWAQLKWDNDDPRTAHYVCELNGCIIQEHFKTKMLAAGKWVPSAPGRGAGLVASFHINSLYSPLGWYSWAQAVDDFLKAKGNQEKLRTFVNTVLGETWKEKGDAPDWRRLYDRRELYEINKLPKGVLLLTAGVDVQKDRLEAQIVGWGRRKEAWSIDYRVFPGDTSDLSASGPWMQVHQMLQEQWQLHGSEHSIPLRMVAVDSGFNTQSVYDFVRRYPQNRLVATKGVEHLQMIIGQPSSVDVASHGKRIRRGLRVWPIGVSTAKSELYGILRFDNPTEEELKISGYPPGFIHFPQFGEDFFRQLTAEQLSVRIVKGFRKYEWQKIYERNEVLDTFILARAAAAIVGIDRFQEEHWRNLGLDLGPIIEKSRQNSENQVKSTPKSSISRRKSSFWEEK